MSPTFEYASPAPLKQYRPPTFVALGDSTSAVPATGSTYPDMLQHLTDRAFVMLYNAGVPGDQTSMMLARIQRDVITYAPSYCIVLGGVNDIANAIPFATTVANLTAIYNILLSAGIQPVAATVTPRNVNATVFLVNDLNNWIKGNAAVRGFPCIDINGSVVDPATSWYQVGVNADAAHPNVVGTTLMGTAAKNVFTGAGLALAQPPTLLPNEFSIPAYAGATPLGTQMIANPLMVDSGAPAGVPSYWALSTSGMTVTKTIVTDSRFVGQAMKWVCSGAAGFHTMKQNIGGGQYSVGDKVRLYVRMAVDAISGVTGTSGMLASLYASGPNTQVFAVNQWKDLITSGVFTVDLVVPSGTTNLAVQLDAQLGGGTATVLWGQCGLINLTRLGLVNLP